MVIFLRGTLRFVVLALPAIVLAQGRSEPESAIEEIVVTGTRIVGIEWQNSLPVTTITREELLSTGDVSLSEALRTQPWYNLGAVAEGLYAAAKLSFGTSDLRGLGPQRTLVLINGRRAGLSAQSEGEAVNMNNIPAMAVERVEILRDGASAIYGSDAIAGVINVILRSDFEGLELGLSASETDEGGGDDTFVTLGGGFSVNDWNLTFTLEHNDRDPVQYSQRNGGQVPVFEYNPVGDPGTWYAEDYFSDGSDVNGPISADVACPEYLSAEFFPWLGVDPDSGDTVTAPQDMCFLEGSLGSEFSPKSEANRVFVTLRQNAGNGFTFQSDLIWTSIDASLRGPTGDEVTDFIAADNSVNPGFDAAAGTAPWPVAMLWAFEQMGEIDHNVDSDYVGLTAAGAWTRAQGQLEIGGQYTREEADEDIKNLSLYQGLRAAVDAGRLNPFEQVHDQAVVDTLRYTQSSDSTAELMGLDATWNASVPIAALEQQALYYAVGLEWRRETFEHNGDPLAVDYQVFGWTHGDYNVDADRDIYSGFVELVLPLSDTIELRYAGRYDDYSEPDASEWTNKLSLRLELLPQLVLRASWGEGFRAPSLYETAAQRVPEFSFQVQDTLRCETELSQLPECPAANIDTVIQGNQDLKPETSEQMGLGLVWEPMGSMMLALDYWQVDIDDQVTVLDTQILFDLEYEGIELPGNQIVRDTSGNVEDVIRGRVNLTGVDASGFDLEFRWGWSTRLGEFDVFSNWSYLDEYKVNFRPGAPTIDFVGSVYVNGGVPEWRSLSGLNWSRGQFNANVTAIGVSDYEDQDFGIKEWWSYDTALGWSTPWDGDLTLGIRNVTNEKIFDPWFHANHDYLGRTYYFQYLQRF